MTRKEIEVKAKVHNLQDLIEKLKEKGISLSQPIVQNDETFVDDNYGDYEKFQPEKNILRIRENDGKFIFTLKQPQKNELDALERETEISNPHEFREALLIMGYKPVVKIQKIRKKAKYKDFEICLDEIKGIGNFIEVEKIISSDKNVEKIQEQLFQFLESLGVRRIERVTQGYDTLVYLKDKILK